MKHRKSPLTAAIVSCLAISFAASAQEAQPDATELDRVVVTGIRASLQQALETKRNADAIVDVITAEDVGKFPATNVAEAMTAITGVTVDRAFGQGERVSILGTDPALNRTLLNGQTIATGDWNMSDFPTRTFNYSLLSPQIVGKVEVYKSPEARLEEGSIGGTVIVSTRKPLDLPRNLLIAGQVSYMRNDLVGKTDPQAALMFGWKNETDTFGITASAQKDVERIRRDGIEAFNLIRARQFAPSIANGNCVGACAEAITANPDAYGPNSTGAHYFEQERDRKTYTLGLQAKPTEKLDLEFNALSIKAGYDHLTHPMYSNQGNAFNSLDKLTDVTIENGVITKGTVKNGLVIFDQQNRLATTKSDTYDFK
ncbi:MAG: TonB-dependent receptor plug domain-containing protein, partial [Stenotrophomonas sp.]